MIIDSKGNPEARTELDRGMMSAKIVEHRNIHPTKNYLRPSKVYAVSHLKAIFKY